MASEGNSTVDSGSESECPTVQELISQLQSSSLSSEVKEVAKNLLESHEEMEGKLIDLEKVIGQTNDALVSLYQKWLDGLQKKQNELRELELQNWAFDQNHIEFLNAEKNCRVSENLELDDELKETQLESDVINEVMEWLSRKVSVYEERMLDYAVGVLSLEKMVEESRGSGDSSIDLEKNMQQQNCASESSRRPLFGEAKNSHNKTEPKKIVKNDVDEDDDQDISTPKGKQVSKKIKKKNNGKKTRKTKKYRS